MWAGSGEAAGPCECVERMRERALENLLAQFNYTDLFQDFNSSTLDSWLHLLKASNAGTAAPDLSDLLGSPPPGAGPGPGGGGAAAAECGYCGAGPLQRAADWYRARHGYLSLAVCVFGTVANLLNVVVLTRRELASAPINRILTGLAVADMLVMVEYVPFACYTYLAPRSSMSYSYGGAAWMLFHAHFTQVLHTISICLTLTLAVWRYIAIRYPERNRTLCTQRRCHAAIAASYALPLALCAPNYAGYAIQRVCACEAGAPLLLYQLDLAAEPRHRLSFWAYSLLLKLLPCLLLTLLSCWLVRALLRANRRHQALVSGYSKCNGEAAAAAGGASGGGRAERRTDRTTRMLVAILLLFLLTELPQGVLGLLSIGLGRCFFEQCYHRVFGELLDQLALLNGAINFILYCTMSRQFRTTFGQLFRPRALALGRWAAPSQATDVQSTYV